MEEEAEKLKQLQSEVDKQMNMGSPPGLGNNSKLIVINFMNLLILKIVFYL